MDRLRAAVFLVALGGCWSSQPAPRAAPAAKRASPPDQADTAVDELLALMRERLLLMHEVAKWMSLGA